MTEDKKNNSRRKVLKAAAGAGLVAGTQAGWESNKWAKPVVESVLLPAHAQTSLDPNGSYRGSTSVQAAVIGQNSSPLDALVESAHAGAPMMPLVSPIPADLCIDIDNNQVNVNAVINGYSSWEGTGALDTVISLSPTGKMLKSCVLENVEIDVKVKGTPPNREAYGNLSFDFGVGMYAVCMGAGLKLTTFSGPYSTPESDSACKLETSGIIVDCCLDKKMTL